MVIINFRNNRIINCKNKAPKSEKQQQISDYSINYKKVFQRIIEFI